MLVRLEDVERDPADVMRRVHTFLGLRPCDDGSTISSRINSAFDNGDGAALTDAEVAWMNLVAEKDIQEAGYVSVRTNATKALLSGSMAGLPVWAIRAIWDLRRTTSGSVVRHALRWISTSTETSTSRTK